MKITRSLINNYQFTIVLVLLLLVAGIFSYLTMPRTENPEIDIPGASVVLIYPGTSPVDLEQLVATPVEDALNEIDDIKQINTTINDGLVYITIEFFYGSDPNEKYDKVLQQINSIKADLPADIYDIITQKWTPSDVAMLQLALVSDSASYRLLNDKAEKLKKDLKLVNGVKKVEIVASPEQKVRIALDIEKMALMNIPIEQVMNAVVSNNANIPGGAIKISDKSFGVKTSGSYQNLEEIKNTVVNSYEGRIIYLKNIAEVNFEYEDDKYLARVNSEKAIFITVNQKEGRNIFNTKADIDKVLNKFKTSLDKDIQLALVFDQSEDVSDRVNGFLSNMLQGIILVGAIILLALGFRSAIIVMISIPLSVMIGLGVIDILDFGMEQMTIAGLVVALGLLVDNSIVMIENINRYILMGKTRAEAAVMAAQEIGWPIISATVTTLLAFIPIAMMPETTGEFIRGLPVTVVATLVISLVLALTLTPLVSSKVLKKPLKNQKAAAIKKTDFLRRIVNGPYRNALRIALQKRWLTVGAATIMFILSMYVFGFVGVSFFPKAEKPQLMIEVDLPDATNIDKTDEVIKKVESVLDTMDIVEYYASNVGHGNPRIYYNVFSHNYASNYGNIFLKTKYYNLEMFDALVDTLRNRLNKIPGAKIAVKEFEQGPDADAPIMVYIKGDDLDKLAEISKHFEELLRKQPGAINLNNNLSKKRTDIYFNINKEKASMYGVPIFEIDRTIRTAVNGMVISTFRDKEGKEYDIEMRMPVGQDFTVDDFDKVYVKSMSGKIIPLNQLAKMEFKKEPGQISRFDLQRSVIISGYVGKGAVIDDIMAPVLEELENYNFPTGYSYHIGGELESREESFGGMQIAVIIALISIFAVLVLQFRSFVQPLIIFAAIPLAIIGSIWALLISGYTFSFTSFIGLTSLIGIVINNSIILVDFTNQLRKEGKSMTEALQIAGETRFTPIILTTLTTIGGLLPLTLQGGTMWAPMGWTIIGGLLVSTFLTLLVVPVLYRLLVKETNYIIKNKN